MQQKKLNKLIRKKFRSKKEIIKEILDADSDLDQYIFQFVKKQQINSDEQKSPSIVSKQGSQIKRQESQQIRKTSNQQDLNIQQMFPLRFSRILIDKQYIRINSTGTYASVNTDICNGGRVALDFKLKHKTAWQLKFDQGVQTSFGVCQIPNYLKQGEPIFYNAQFISSGIKIGQFQFQPGNLINLSFDPDKGNLAFFNTNTLKYCSILVQKRQQNFEYYPFVQLHKCSVQLMMDYLIGKAKKQHKKSFKKY